MADAPYIPSPADIEKATAVIRASLSEEQLAARWHGTPCSHHRHGQPHVERDALTTLAVTLAQRRAAMGSKESR